jgi:pimeloyl-ACP methyl ester carboxylesterase
VYWSLTAGVPTTYVINVRDLPIPVELQREMAARLPGPAQVVELDVGHYAPFTQPTVFADVIHAATRSVIER